MQHCRPFGLLVIASAIRGNIHRFPQCKHTIINTKMTQGGRFAAYSGFYKSIGFDVGYSKEETGDRFIPIREITAKELHEQYTNTTVLNDKVNWYSRLLSNTLVGGQPNEVIDAIQYCFREIIRNTFEHGKTNSLWVSGQYWPSRHEAEIAILDEGIGILKSLVSNPRITANTCEEANLLALQPGLSRTIGMKQDSFDRWQNSGYGLYVASTICGINGGYFMISSGDSSILVNADGHRKYFSNQIGTAVCLKIQTNSKKLINFDRTLKMVVKEGEERAKDNGGKRILIQVSKPHQPENVVQCQYRHQRGKAPCSEPTTPSKSHCMTVS